MWPKFHAFFNSIGESAAGPPTKKNGTTNRTNNPDNQEGKLAFKKILHQQVSSIPHEQFVTKGWRLVWQSVMTNNQ